MKIRLKFIVIASFSAFAILCLWPADLQSQNPVADDETFETRYAQNIKKSRINGVYIPSDIDDAITELKALSTKEALAKFALGKEDIVAKKLHFGIGRWMIYNWNFYEGSRFSHYLRELGINHPDDQAKFVIIVFHRALNNKELDMDNLIHTLQAERAKMYEKTNKATVIKEEKRIKQKN